MSNLDIIKKNNGDINFSNSGGGITLNNQKILTLDEVYPVGSIYITTSTTSPDSTTSPASFIGGTWELLKDRFLVGAGNLYSGGAIGGEATHTLTQGEMPSHKHDFRVNDTEISWRTLMTDMTNPNGGWGHGFGNIEGWHSAGVNTSIANTGGDQPHNNMPPYLAVFIWKRIS